MSNKFADYRDIRYRRAFKTLGKMSWWRVALGVVLIIFVIFLSGLPSQMLAARGMFVTAEKLMISPEWMEKYKPDTKAFIEAGVLYENGEYEQAAAAFASITEVDAAATMKNAAELRLAMEKYAGGEFDASYDAFIRIDSSELNEDDLTSYNELSGLLKLEENS